MTASIHSFLDEWSVAERAGDAGKLDSLLTEDIAGIGPVGFLLPKAEWLAHHQQGLPIPEAVTAVGLVTVVMAAFGGASFVGDGSNRSSMGRRRIGRHRK
jgi:hypothetical protein